GGQLDPVLFWHFVSALAQGRGIASELADAAAGMLSSGNIDPSEPERFWQGYHWAVLFHLLKRLKSFEGGILPDGFEPLTFMSSAANIARGEKRYPDALGLGTGGGDQNSMARAAQAQLVMAVLFRMVRDGISEREARRHVLPHEGQPTETDDQHEGFARTWSDWKARTAEFKNVPVEALVEDAKAAVRGEIPSETYDLDGQTIQQLWHWAFERRSRNPRRGKF
ncbi:MAG: hypothetical protein KDK08_07260, partial [Rhizobiaceae bacterium]|nr:hypothetical protein [Rhizobiaceae bacterium]